MIRFTRFKKLSEETFNEEQAVKDALEWLKNKYGEDLYNFKYIPNMDMNSDKVKTYDISVKDNTYTLNLRIFKTSEPNQLDTLGFDVLPSQVLNEPDTQEEKKNNE